VSMINKPMIVVAAVVAAAGSGVAYYLHNRSAQQLPAAAAPATIGVAKLVPEPVVKPVGSYKVADVLVVADNMRRALDAVAPELRASAETGVKALIDGVELTERELLKALENNGVRQFTPQGEKFDPNLHQAMFEVPDASVPAGSVVQVVQPGYMIGERMLRPALVGVSKGGPRTAPASPAANDTKAAANDP
jgi:hypothetical protein